MSFRDPLRDAAAAWGSLTQGLMQGAAVRREDRLRTEDVARREAELRRQEELAERARVLAQANQNLQLASEGIARLQALPPGTERDQQIAVLTNLAQQLQAVEAAEDPVAAYRALATGGVGATGGQQTLQPTARERAAGRGAQQAPAWAMPPVPVAAAIGRAQGVAAAGARSQDQDEAVMAANSEELREVYRTLSGGINLESQSSIANVEIMLERALSLQGAAVLPADRARLAELPRFAQAVLATVTDDPALQKVRELAGRLAEAQVSTAESGALTAAAQAQIARHGIEAAKLDNLARAQNLELGELTGEQMRQAIEAGEIEIAIRQGEGLMATAARFRETGLVNPDDPNYAALVRQYGGEAGFRAEQDRRFKAFIERQAAEDQLLRLAGVEGQLRNEMLGIEIDTARYLLDRAPIDAALSDAGQAANILQQAMLNGDHERIYELMRLLRDDPDSPMARALASAGHSVESLGDAITQASQNRTFNDRQRSLALEEAELALSAARRGDMINAADLRARMATSLTPDDIDNWWRTLSDAERQLLGGETALAGMKRDSLTHDFLMAEPMRADAYQRVAAMVAARPSMANERPRAADEIYNALVAAGVDEGYAFSYSKGVLGIWEREDWEFLAQQEQHDLWAELTREQINEIKNRVELANRQANEDIPPELLVDVEEARQLLSAESLSYTRELNALITRMEQNYCVVITETPRWEGDVVRTRPGDAASTDLCRGMAAQHDNLYANLTLVNDDLSALVIRATAGGLGARLPRVGGAPAAPAPATGGSAGPVWDSVTPVPQGPSASPAQAAPPEAAVPETVLPRSIVLQMTDLVREGSATYDEVRTELRRSYPSMTAEEIEEIIRAIETTLDMYGYGN